MARPALRKHSHVPRPPAAGGGAGPKTCGHRLQPSEQTGSPTETFSSTSVPADLLLIYVVLVLGGRAVAIFLRAYASTENTFLSRSLCFEQGATTFRPKRGRALGGGVKGLSQVHLHLWVSSNIFSWLHSLHWMIDIIMPGCLPRGSGKYQLGMKRNVVCLVSITCT